MGEQCLYAKLRRFSVSMQGKKLVGFEVSHCVRLPYLIGKLDEQSLFTISLQEFHDRLYLSLR
jgi:hypothetical protein